MKKIFAVGFSLSIILTSCKQSPNTYELDSSTPLGSMALEAVAPGTEIVSENSIRSLSVDTTSNVRVRHKHDVQALNLRYPNN